MEMQQRSYFGINFGTTNTAVVRIIRDEFGERILPLGDVGIIPFSSIIAIPKQGEEIMFGQEVRKQRENLSAKHEIITSIKSYLGTDKEFIVGSNKYSAQVLTAKFLEAIKNYIHEVHKVEIKEAGFSFPVDFTPEARSELCKAAEQEGIKVKSFVSESTAAYFANRKEGYGYSRIMVLDWGGGSFDISILDISKDSVSELSVYGENIGGDDIDKNLANRVHANIIKQTNLSNNIPFDEMPPACRDQLLSKCEQAKIEITETNEDFQLTVVDYDRYGTKSVKITVDFFNDIVESIVKKRILKAIDRALERASLTRAEIDAIIVVGGSSNLNPYKNIITNLFGKDKIIIPSKPQWSTAEGAALMQIIGGNFRLNDSLGVLLSDDSIFPILSAKKDGVGSKSPTWYFSLVEDSQTAYFIFTNGDGTITYEKAFVETKGFLDERIQLNAEIGEDQIARIEIKNRHMGNRPPTKVEINKLTFHYNTSSL